MAGHYRTTIDHNAVVRIVGEGLANAAAKRAATITAQRARSNVIEDGLVNTGRLAKSFKVKDVTVNPLKQTYKVGSTDPAAIYPEKGTRVVPAAPGRILRFKPKGSSIFVFARSTGPVRAYGFMKRARRAITRRDFLPR